MCVLDDAWVWRFCRRLPSPHLRSHNQPIACRSTSRPVLRSPMSGPRSRRRRTSPSPERPYQPGRRVRPAAPCAVWRRDRDRAAPSGADARDAAGQRVSLEWRRPSSGVRRGQAALVRDRRTRRVHGRHDRRQPRARLDDVRGPTARHRPSLSYLSPSRAQHGDSHTVEIRVADSGLARKNGAQTAATGRASERVVAVARYSIPADASRRPS